MPDPAADRRHVTPADPAATIPDPSRGRPLPPDGAAVAWGPYWALLAARGDVTVRPLAPEPPEPAEPAEPPELVARHRGAGSWSVMQGAAEIVEGLTRAEAESFNAGDAAARAAFVAARA